VRRALVGGAAASAFSLAAALVAAPAAAAPAGWTSVRVRAGDTLSGLATRYGSTVPALAAANRLIDSNRILAGQSLAVPPAGGSGADFQLVDFVIPSAAPTGWLPTPVRLDPARRALVPVFQTWAAHYGIDAALLEAMCWWESGWQTGVVSSTGAIGIGQLEPSTVDQMRRSIGDPRLSPWRPADNIRMSAGYLAWLLQATNGDASLALAGYYQGLRDVRRRGPLPSTRHYVSGIEAYAALFRS